MQRIWLAVGMAAVVAAPLAQAATELYFSEYVEGSSYNKALEIYNNTGAAVDLAGYEVQMYFNGNTSPGLTLPLSGAVPHGKVFVLAHSSADPAILAVSSLVNGAGWFNGDDAIVLRRNGVVIDSIGQIGVDPGSQWGSGVASTGDNTLRRKAAIDAGDPDPYDPFDPALEWDGYASNTFDGLGNQQTDTPVLIGACGDAATPIHAIQGDGMESPMQGERVVVEAVVVGDFQASGRLSGFFVQEEDGGADADPLTSEGLFVYHRIDALRQGDIVRLAGRVAEYSGLTELVDVREAVICSSGGGVTPVTLELPLPEADYLERYEGMRVTSWQTLTVSENYNLGRYGELILSSGGRLPIPTHVAAPGADALAVQAANDLNRVILDDGSTRQNPDPIVYPAPRLTAHLALRTGDQVTGLEAVVHEAFGEYRLQPVITPAFVAANPRPAAPELPGKGQLRVASFNVLNYFNGDGQGNGFPTARGASTPEEFERQRAKIVNALVAMDADILGLMEIENDGYDPTSAIADLTDALSTASGQTYAFVRPPMARLGTDEIAVGFLYRVDTVALTGKAAILDASIDPDFDDSRNRPALAQSFRELASGEVLTVVVNHLKSKGSACDDLGDPDMGDGQGNCNQTRTRAAQALARWLATDPTGSGDPDVLVIGDLNAYAKEDPIRALTAAGYSDLIDRFIGEDAYSYVFQGQSGYLDHALANGSLSPQVSAVTEWHINADEPRVLDYNVEFKSPDQIIELYSPEPYRASDHDPVIVELDLWTPLIGDFDGDRRRSFWDFLLLLGKLGSRAEPGEAWDLNEDGRVTGRDVAAWLRLDGSPGRRETASR